MTIKLNHEQACILRSISAIGYWFDDGEYFVDKHQDLSFLLCVDHGGALILSDAGRQALAAYDAEWMVVRRDDVRFITKEVRLNRYESRGECEQLDRIEDALEAKS